MARVDSFVGGFGDVSWLIAIFLISGSIPDSLNILHKCFKIAFDAFDRPFHRFNIFAVIEIQIRLQARSVHDLMMVLDIFGLDGDVVVGIDVVGGGGQLLLLFVESGFSQGSILDDTVLWVG